MSLSLSTLVKKNLDNTSIDISRANSLTDEMDYEDIPLPVVTDEAQ